MTRALVACMLMVEMTLAAIAETVCIERTPFGKFSVIVPEFASRNFLITDYGAKKGEKCTMAIAAAMDACALSGGGRVVVPAGRWLTGRIHFRSNCEFHLNEGAVLEFTDDPKDYLPPVHTSWEGVECLNYSPLIYAYGVENIAITGSGEIRPRIEFWRSWFERPPAHMRATALLYHWCATNAPMTSRDLTAIPGSNVRPHLVHVNRSKNVLIEGVSVKESPFWMIHLYHSENCIVRSIRSYCHGHNNDGIDVEMTKNVLIENCDLDQGDDGIVLKAGRNQDAWRLNRPTENVVVRNCNLHMSHSLLGIGSELSGGVRNVWLRDCRVECSGSMVNIKTNRRRGGFVENVWVENVMCSDSLSGSVFSINSDAIFQWAKFPDYELRYTRIRNINIRNAMAGACSHIVNLNGDAHCPPQDLTMDGVCVRFARKEERNVVNCGNVILRNFTVTHPEERILEVKRVPVVIQLQNAVMGAAFIAQLSNSLPEISRLTKQEIFPGRDGCVRTALFPGEYMIRWSCKDGVDRRVRIMVGEDGLLAESGGALGDIAEHEESGESGEKK